jgi:hypothetical protein
VKKSLYLKWILSYNRHIQAANKPSNSYPKKGKHIMAIQEYKPDTIINLSNEEGNVFALISIASRLSKEIEKDGKAITKEMISSDYRNAVYVFNREFGEFFDIILQEGMTAQSLKDSYLKTNLTEEKMQEGYLK